jgi:DNA-binding GntR family transcriptional regulator
MVLVPAQLRWEIEIGAPVLRDALRLLEREGLVCVAGTGRRFQVARLASRDLVATYEVLEGLDGLGARLAAAAGLSDAVEERFAAATAEMVTARTPSLDPDSFERAHALWHQALFDASGNAYLRGSSHLVGAVSHCLVWRSLPPAVQRRGLVERRQLVDSGMKDHARILRAIRAGDSAGAEQLARRHRRLSANFARVAGGWLAAPGTREAAETARLRLL